MTDAHPYRGYTIRPVTTPADSAWYFEHDSFDGPGDTRYGYGDTLAECAELIDDQIADLLADNARQRMREGL